MVSQFNISGLTLSTPGLVIIIIINYFYVYGIYLEILEHWELNEYL